MFNNFLNKIILNKHILPNYLGKILERERKLNERRNQRKMCVKNRVREEGGEKKENEQLKFEKV